MPRAGPATPPRPTALLRAVPGFGWLWTAGLVSLTGTHMQFVALPYFVYEQTRSTFATAVSAAAQALPGITLAPLAGAVTDSHDARRVFLAANAVLAVVTLGFCLTLVAPWWVVLVTALLQASVAQLVAPAEVVLVPALVPAPSLPAANGLLGANTSLARLVGPAAGGLLYAACGLPAVAIANASSFAAAAMMVSRVPLTVPTSTAPGGGIEPTALLPRSSRRRRLAAGWPEGWREIRRQTLLVRLLVVFVLTGIGEGCVSALLAPYVQQVFGSSTALGLLLSCQAAGGIAGALAVSRWVAIGRLPQTLGRAALACAVFLFVLTGYPLFYAPLWPTLLLIAVAGFPFAVVAAAQTTLLQVLARPAVRGRAFGVLTATSAGAQLLGILASGYLADQTSVYLLMADAPCYLLAGLAVLLTGPRRRAVRRGG